MSILFAIVFLVVIFKCVGLVLGVCGKLLGAVLSLFWIYLIHRLSEQSYSEFPRHLHWCCYASRRDGC